MTPFDGAALLAVLLAFYMPASVAALQRAFAERPEYFAAGRLGGSKGEKLFLPDGRVFDLILAAGGPLSGQRWQVLEDAGAAGGEASPWPLEPGALVPLADGDVFAPGDASAFESLVAGELGALEGSDAVLDLAAAGAVEFDGGAGLEASSAALLDPAGLAHVGIRAALEHDDPADELEAAGLTRETIDSAITEYDEPKPDPAPEDDPGENPPPPDEPPQA